ncbi:myb domain-containing protein [Tieghemostelium lacteum]|uniref:Myb domain-containing protein n=1 Tax=Tieghemostelium lacteum TaxID=361077 RepID=A0A152A2Z4_TIELA|nr:myb domain-containing protein [Tieghemostelium lacteum]|eukprot:KYR00580.1 myb domain-containing protein [Tieghemostelium lacteum]
MSTTGDFIITVDPIDLSVIDFGGKDQIHYATVNACKQCNIEPIGKEFESLWKRMTARPDMEIIGLDDKESSSDDAQEEDENSEEFAAFKEKYQNKHKEWSKQKEQDHYEIMGLSKLRWRATEEDIKQAYKKMILIVHPDKNEGMNDEAFKLLQKSYGVLSDLKKRRAYDSQEAFDDSIPTQEEADEGDFFEIFEPVFEMNSRFSLIQPAPKLGDLNTPYDKVLKFYNFWWSFKSWRDFSFEDDYDLEQGDSREEKRWMERQNEKKRAKHRKEESTRIMDLANLAYKKDPRILKKIKDEEDKKIQAKQAKIDARKKLQEEAEASEKAEKERVEMEEKKKKEEQQEKKKAQKLLNQQIHKSKEQFRQVCYAKPEPFQPHPTIEDVELICLELSHLELDDATARFGSEADKKQVYADSLQKAREKAAERDQKLQASKKSKQENEQSEKIWTDEELHQLAKAIQKYPVGLQNRWEMVASMVPTRTLKEVIAKAKLAQPTKAFSKPVVQQASHYDKLKQKVGDKNINSELSSRYEYEQPSSTSTTTTPSTPVTTTPTTTTTTPATPTAATSKKESAKKEEWSEKEQKLLEEGLSTIDKSLEDRWDRIAKHVGTKSKKECVARYKHLVTLYKNQAK